MEGHPRLIYWKWDDDILEGERLKNKIDELVRRSNFDSVFVAVQWLGKSFMDARLTAAFDKACRMLHAEGRKFMLDLDVRNEVEGFFAKYPGHYAYLLGFHECDLDGAGEGFLEVEDLQMMHYNKRSGSSGIEAIANSWCFNLADEAHFAPSSLCGIKDRTFMEKAGEAKTGIRIKAGEANAGKRALVCSLTRQACPDLFSPKLYEHFAAMFESVKHIPLDGIGVDEWGFDLDLKIDEGGCLLDGRIVATEYLPMSRHMADEYKQRTGRELADDLLYLRYLPEGDAPRAYAVVNDYLANIRRKMAENEAWFYDKGKMTFGTDTFIGLHPTWWGSEEELYLEILKNGFDWWEVKRDYGQTDESILIPIRLALAHKWGSPVWYNMWYSSGTLKLETYFAETWRNARYGGRTHYLAYECPNEGVVLELKQQGMLEEISAMEERLGGLNSFQVAQPDSRVLIIFGMEAVSNWHLSNPGQKQWTSVGALQRDALKFANDLFKGGYLCDIVPSTEVINQDVFINEHDKVSYGTQTYDAVIILFPEFTDVKILDFLRQYTANRGNAVLIGDCRYYADGKEAAGDFAEAVAHVEHHLAKPVEMETVVRILETWGVPRNTYENGCVYQDGSVVFTAQGLKCKGNRLIVDSVIKGHRVEFEGEDYLGIDLGWDGRVKRVCAGRTDYLRVDGRPVADPSFGQS